MLKHAVALLVLAGCSNNSTLLVLGAGPTTPIGDGAAQETGVAAQVVGGADGGGFHLNFRRADDTQELALGLTVFAVDGPKLSLDPPFLGMGTFVRAGINLIEWDRVGMDDGAGIGGLTVEVGASWLVMCASVSASRDFRFNDRDNTFFGINLGVCAIDD